MPSLHKHKKIIVCCDGTWNRPEKEWASSEIESDKNNAPITNVLKVARLLQPRDNAGSHQVIYYDPGVGTDRGLFDRFVGGMTGLGLSAHLKKAYRFLCHNYVDQDELYFFGFSRGAYTVRALGGMIGCVGLLQPENLQMLPAAFDYYNTHPLKRKKHSFQKIAEDCQLTRHVQIKMIGVWDTVGALGVPIPYVGPLTRKWVGFFDTELGGHVEYGYHAVAIDERRGPFKPDLWTQHAGNTVKETATKEICQVWFPGSHSDVGGGAKDLRLSNESLLWMVCRAKSVGLDFKDKEIQDIQKCLDRHNSCPENSFRWLYKSLVAFGVLPYTRVIGAGAPPIDYKIPANSPVRNQPVQSCQPLNEMIHESGFQKYLFEKTDHSIAQYAPKNLSQDLIYRLPVFRENIYHRRDFVRLPAGGQGAIELNDRCWVCDVVDFSKNGGAKLRFDQQLNIIGKNVILFIFEGDNAGEYFGRVAWEKKYNLGLMFIVKHDDSVGGNWTD